MSLSHLFLLCAVAAVISACGGSGGTASTPPSNGGNTSSTPNSASAAASSMAAVTSCATYEGAVFVDSVCSQWRKPYIFELNSITSVNREITDTQVGEGLTYSIVDAQDPAHRQVFDIHYANQTIVNGVALLAPVTTSKTVDLSAYATGKLIFDINVINQGTAKADIEFNVECGWPCGSTPIMIKSTTLNKWQTIEVSVAEMISRGLNIKNVTSAFVLLPTWGKQANTHYQLDNIRWVKGNAVTPTETICYANYLDEPFIAGVQGNGASMYTVDANINLFELITTGVVTTSINPYATIRPNWSVTGGHWSYSLSKGMSYVTGQLLTPSTLSACSAAGTLSLEIYFPKSYIDDGNLKFSLHFLDNNRNIHEIPNSQFSTANLKPDDWNKISVDLSAATQHADLMYVGLSIDSTLISPALTDDFKIDNIIITQKTVNATSSVTSSKSSAISSFKSSSKTSSSSMSHSSGNPSSTPVTSSSSSSVFSALTQNLFIDQLDSAWKNLSTWEGAKDRLSSAEYTDGTQGQLIHWAVIPSADQGRGNVIDVQFTNNTTVNGLFHITTLLSAGQDMSQFATGKLVFDIKLLNAGNLSPSLDVLMECKYPCVSHTFPLVIPNTNEWFTQEIAIADFIEGGLNINKVDMVFEIVPSWNKQTGVQFQLDNIRWIEGNTPAPIEPAPCYRQPYETWNIPFHFDALKGSPNVINGALLQIIAQSKIAPNWTTDSDKLGYSTIVDNTFAACAFTNSSLSAQIYLPKSYVLDGNMQLGFYYEDANNKRAYFSPVSAATLKADGWKTISAPVSAYNGVALSPFVEVDTFFNANNITHIGIYIDANGKPTNVVGEIQIDNIVIK